MTAGERTRSRALVAAQMVLLAVLATGGPRGTPPGAPRPAPVLRTAGWALLASGAALAVAGAAALGDALSPMPEPKPGTALRTEGPYRLVRHPVYAGLLLGAAGRALSTGRPHHGLAAAALAGVLSGKVRHEETLLRERFPDYDAYASRTPALLPRPRGSRR